MDFSSRSSVSASEALPGVTEPGDTAKREWPPIEGILFLNQAASALECCGCYLRTVLVISGAGFAARVFAMEERRRDQTLTWGGHSA